MEPQGKQLIVDGTLGDGGHAELILKHTGQDCRVLGIDRDAEILERAGVAVTPGLDFDPVRGHRWIRFSYARSTADIVEGLRRLAAFMAARGR